MRSDSFQALKRERLENFLCLPIGKKRLLISQVITVVGMCINRLISVALVDQIVVQRCLKIFVINFHAFFLVD